ncbi:MAG: TIGR03084 family protein [Acidimicrobiales bacterium]|nr:TIGR03084 family protein [Acidimicrobiales bacterium]
MDVADVLADLLAEQAALDAVVVDLTDEQAQLPTPADRWTIADQLSHLTYFDHNAALAIRDPEAFPATVHALIEAAAGGDEAVDEFEMGAWRRLPAAELLEVWREGRSDLEGAARTLGDADRVAWYGPSMGSKSFLTARLMECWAHGQDVVDALRADGAAVDRPATDRLAHIARLGYLTRGWSYINRGMSPPDGDVAVVLDAPSGAVWSFGDSETDRVSGPAEDFCLVVTQRRHVDDTALEVEGDVARDWMVRAQAFAGPATDGPDAKAEEAR